MADLINLFRIINNAIIFVVTNDAYICPLQSLSNTIKVGLSRLRKFSLIENFPRPFSKKYHHLFVWCLKRKINEF